MHTLLLFLLSSYIKTMIAPVRKVERIWVMIEEEALAQVDRGVSVWVGSPCLAEILLVAKIPNGVEIKVVAAESQVEILKKKGDLRVGRTKDLQVIAGDVPR
jgi:hypothetical protein